MFGLRAVYYNSFWGADGGLLHSYKYENFREALRYLFSNNRKGFYINANNINTSFNMWLDYARDYGIYTFAMLYGFKLLTVVYAIRLLFAKNIATDIKALLISAFVAFNVFYSFESIAKTQVYLWFIGLIIIGITKETLSTKKVGNSCGDRE